MVRLNRAIGKPNAPPKRSRACISVFERWLIRSALPPHPGPLLQGEVEQVPVLQHYQSLTLAAAPVAILPLLEGESVGQSTPPKRAERISIFRRFSIFSSCPHRPGP